MAAAANDSGSALQACKDADGVPQEEVQHHRYPQSRDVGIAVSAGLVNALPLPRFGPRPLVPVGMLIAAAGMLWLAQLGTSSSYVQAVLGPIILLGLGMGFAFAPSIMAATAGIAPVDAGVGSAMVSSSQQIGGAIGLAAQSTVFSTAVTSYLTTHTHSPQLQQNALVHGYTTAFTISAAVFLIGSVLAAVLFRSGRIQTSPDLVAVPQPGQP